MKRSLRERGYSKFKTVEHPVTKRTADIKVDKSDGQFACEIGDMTKIDASLVVVEKWAIAMLKKSEKTNLVWLPVIDAHVEGDRYGYGRRKRDEDTERAVEVKVRAKRFWLAKASRDPNGNEVWRTLHWIQGDKEDSGYIEEDQQYEMSTVYREPRDSSWQMTPAEKKGWVRLPEVDGGHYLLAYTPELWAGIQHVIDTIENEEKILDKLFRTKEGQETLTKLGSQPELLRLTSGG